MVISKDLQDKAMRFIIDYYNSHSQTHYINKDSLIKKEICSKEDVDHLIDVLKAQELIGYGPSDREDADHIQILPNGHLYFEKREQEKQEEEKENQTQKKETRRFWIEILKDVVIFVIGLIIEGKFGVIRGILTTIFAKG